MSWLVKNCNLTVKLMCSRRMNEISQPEFFSHAPCPLCQEYREDCKFDRLIRRNTISIKFIFLKSLGPEYSAHTIFRCGNYLFTATRAVRKDRQGSLGNIIKLRVE